MSLAKTWSGRLEAGLGRAIEFAAAALVVAEIVILLTGVIARYGVQRPLIWSDELASMLFLWLAMLGSVIALRRNEHMRMTALVARLSERQGASLEVFAIGAALAFLLMVAWPAYEFAQDEAFITTPALEMSNAWRAAALPAGISLMAVFALLRLMREASVATMLTALGTLVLLITAFWL
ncbi:MAG: TRAP transporter small permease, partial [Bradyrhizobiaceae bacterium]|nr:TRAP transporter small permease [Bradyrhizobiaceae bacterium]